VISTWVAIGYGWPLETRFALARGSLESDAKAVLQRTLQPGELRSSGGYRLFSVVSRPAKGIVIFETTDGRGFAYVAGQRPGTRGDRYEHLGGAWYLWTHRAPGGGYGAD
jgi:hypothetical protein